MMIDARPIITFQNDPAFGSDLVNATDEYVKAEVKRLRAHNHLYDVFNPKWQFYLSAYEGGDWFSHEGNIFKHVRENEADYHDRIKRVHNLNYCQPIVDFYTNFIFSEAIDRAGGKNQDWYKDFLKDVNLRGDDIDTFMRCVSDDQQIFGMTYIFVDTPRVEQNVISRADAQDLKLRPYWVLAQPEEVTDWVLDEFGVFQYVKRFQTLQSLAAGGVRTIERYTEYYIDRIDISEIDVTDPRKQSYKGRKSVENSLEEIPCVLLKYKPSKMFPHMGTSFLIDFAKNNREVINLTSILQEFLYRQAFNILARETETVIPTKEQHDGEIGTSNVMDVPKGAQFPQYISPPSAPAQIIQDERGRVINEMFKRAAQDALTELFNGESKSGFSQAQSFSKTVPFIASRADSLERAENALMRLTMKYMGKDWDGKIRYKDRYEITNLTDALVQLQMLVRDFQIQSPTFVKEELKRMIREYDGKLPPDTLMQVEKEIEAIDFKTWFDVQTQALVGGGGSSPTAQQKPKDTMTMRETASEAKTKTTATTSLKE